MRAHRRARSRVRFALAWSLCWVVVACGASDEGPPPEPAITSPGAPFALQPRFSGLPAFTFPAAMTQAPGDRSRWFVLEQQGRVRAFPNDAGASETQVVLDISDKVVGPELNWEAGLLGLAFHPRFAANRYVYVFYVTKSETSAVGTKWVVSRFVYPPGAAGFDRDSESVVISADCGYVSYYGGTLAFGPDGDLYISVGQNVASDTDPHPAQDPGRWEGSILRIDVDSDSPYGIPEDNPFRSGGGAPEVYAYGFRNPWKLSFDPPTGRIWSGDVGERGAEEINSVRAGRNYGWNRVEGDACRDDCPPDYEAPVHAYAGPHAAVISGYTYRGAAIPELVGVFLFADFMRGEISGLRETAGGQWQVGLLFKNRKGLGTKGLIGTITSFAQDPDGELFVVNRGGRIFELVPATAAVASKNAP